MYTSCCVYIFANIETVPITYIFIAFSNIFRIQRLQALMLKSFAILAIKVKVKNWS